MSLLETFDLYNILFLDIETVPIVSDFEELSEEMQELWAIKARGILRKTEEELQFDEIADGRFVKHHVQPSRAWQLGAIHGSMFLIPKPGCES